ncbi:cobalt ECF transporter T component CbiQ [Halomicrobium mukohataei]|uniref:Cobalt ECF transporter T component CbiQ n=1 Tax=Halomicrobium mukohataei TaxID=57705 RepID=A0A847UBW4_9EURY|nr:cobalt ECF transporter T component CbiQ [Halomicrobium mukohataei]NLV08578.1 cobalt ECF transporter T component CbiQ [Halomicrobium mukohataei]
MDALDRTVAAVSDEAQSFLVTTRTPRRDGFMQAVDPALKLVGVLSLLVIAVVTDDLAILCGLAALPLGLAIGSRIAPLTLGRRIALPVLASAAVVAPQAVLQPGPTVAALGPLSLSATGVTYVAVFLVRVTASLALLSVLLLTTGFGPLVTALRRLRVPPLAITLLAVTYRSLLLFFRELERMAHARRSRTFSRGSLQGRWARSGSFLGTFLLRSLDRGERVQRAARARGGTRMRPYDRSGSLGRADAAFALLLVAAVVVRVIAA